MTATSAMITPTITVITMSKIAFAVSQFADLKQKQDSAIVRKGIERACAERGQAMHQRGIDAMLSREAHKGVT